MKGKLFFSLVFDIRASRSDYVRSGRRVRLHLIS